MTILEKMTAKDIGERLRIARENAKLTQADAAGVIEVARTTLIAIEQGQRRVRMNELQRPIMVQRNSLVTISLRTPYMSLTTQGRAIEDGGKGDVIHVTNLQSKRTFEAVVDGPNSVVVHTSSPRNLTN